MVAIIGGYQSDFARNITTRRPRDLRPGRRVRDRHAGDAGIEADRRRHDPRRQRLRSAVHRSGSPGRHARDRRRRAVGRAGRRATRPRAPPGRIAVLAAMAELEAGRYDCALVLGVEVEKSQCPATRRAQHAVAAAWVGHESDDADPIWPAHVRAGSPTSTTAATASTTCTCGPSASSTSATRRTTRAHRPVAWSLTRRELRCADDAANPVVSGRIRRNDCSQITDGAAGVVLVVGPLAGRHIPGRSPQRRPDRPAGATAPSGCRSPRSSTARHDDDYVMPHVRRTITDAFARAGIADVDGLDVIEIHDCFTPSEYMAIDHFGITAPGRELERRSRTGEHRTRRRDAGQPVGRPHRRRPPRRRDRRPHAPRRSRARSPARPASTRSTAPARSATLNIGGSTATTVSFVVVV